MLLTWLIVSYFILLFMTCFSIVMVLHYLYRAVVRALFSLVVLLITYSVVKSHFILLFEQIKKERKFCSLYAARWLRARAVTHQCAAVDRPNRCIPPGDNNARQRIATRCAARCSARVNGPLTYEWTAETLDTVSASSAIRKIT